ncbi:MAG TPA: Rieske 2Fe-2S domain-containing protein [Mycobacterium sp.]|nr:Rieske 2Fe-2S domain-containing protein [Mycobacterium sp.]
MAKPVLSMKPTGWFQVAWSAEIETGQIRAMKYFDRELIAWRAEDSTLTVMDAHCEHLGAHLGFGGRVEGDRIICPFHGWEWNQQGRNVCIPYQDRPNKGRRIPTWPVIERNESVYVWHDLQGRTPYFDVPDIFDAYDDGRTADDYYLAYPEGVLHHERLELHPQYVMENGVDFAHFKFVHRAVHVPEFTRQEFEGPIAYADFEMLFGGTKESTVLTPNGAMVGGVQAINIGIGVGLAKFWGPDNMRTIVTVTPIDEETADIRSTVWLDRVPGDESAHQPASLERRQRMANNQYLADLNIWQHQRYTEPPALATAEGKGFRALRRWAMQFYPPGEPGGPSTPELQTAGTDASLELPDNEATSARV